MATDQWKRLNDLEKKRITTITDEDIHKTQLLICGQAKDASDAGLLMAALGVHPKRVRIGQTPVVD